MRQFALILSVTVALAACSPSPPAGTPESPAAKPASAPAATAAKEPAAAATPAREIPVGACGDQSKLPAAERVANTARWSTASEQNSFGFDVFRSDTEKGEYRKLTENPILGAGTSDETHKYEFRDDSIDPCRDYWYYVDQIDNSGTHEKITPNFHAPAKHRAAGAAPAVTPAPANG